MTYRIILADPPWPSENSVPRGHADRYYSLMTLDEICRVPVPTAKDAALFLWARSPALPEAFTVITAWGFQYKTVAFVWEKVAASGEPRWGCGSYTRPSVELCLLATRGKLEVQAHDVGQIIRARRGPHSRKPDEVYDRIERLFGDLPRIEMFARREIVGWDSWGNQVGGGAAPSESQAESQTRVRGLDRFWE